ncbi:alpha/beta hydrolase [Actinomadura sp. NPDC047616]|uniref:alpha/beta hydrolase n=1 Tax=Actinomadura sp. NPDC047616 TaxID=3155914 RepID=UPI0033F2FADE
MEPVIDFRPGVSREARRFALFMRTAVRPMFAYGPMRPSMLRLAMLLDLGAPMVMRPPRGTEIGRVRLGDFHGEWVRPAGGSGARVILYLHGGGFFCCGLRTHRGLVARIAERSDAVAFSVAYRQLPTAPLAMSMADALAAYRWILDQGCDPERLVIAGDSAGAYLAFTTVIAARDAGLPVPAGIVGLSPLTDLDHEVRASYEYTRRDAYIPAHRLGALKRLLLAGMEPDAVVSPCDRDLRGLPPVFMLAGSREALRWDAELMAGRLAEAGVPHLLQIWEEQVHVFPAFAGAVPEGRQAIEEIGSFVRARTSSHPLGVVA